MPLFHGRFGARVHKRKFEGDEHVLNRLRLVKHAKNFLRPKAAHGVFLIGEYHMNQIVLDARDRVGEPYVATAEDQYCGSSNSTTSTRAFLGLLRAAKPDQQLVFQLDEAPLVAAGYHVTEVKAVTYNTMDCGGVANKWKETVIQLWNPGDEPEREYMTVRKFLAIYERVAEHIPVSYDAELRFEYGDTRRPAASYHVERLESRGALVLVHLRAPVVTCKARDRKKASIAAPESSCCG